MKTDSDPNYGPSKAAEHAGVSRGTWYRWLKEGIAPPPDGRTPTGDPRWKRSTIDRLLRESLSKRIA